MGIMCRNHRGFIESTVALSKLGADALYLNTAFAGPQLAEVASARSPRRDHLRRGVHGLLSEAGHRRKRFVAWHDSETAARPHARRADRGRGPSDVVPPRREGARP